MTTTIGVLPVRAGSLPPGATEVAAEAGGRCWLIGTGCRAASDQLLGSVDELTLIEAPPFDGPLWAAVLGAAVGPAAHLLLPHSADGRDLAPHLAAVLDRPLVSGATRIGPDRAVVARQGGLTMETLSLDRPVVATFQVGARACPPSNLDRAPTVRSLDFDAGGQDQPPDRVELIEELDADPRTMDLAEAPRIVAGGAGLGEREHFELLHDIADELGASVGATRVVTDWGWIDTDRQIGTTGVMVDPDLYLAIGISGAVQHTAGLGGPDHVVAVNTDPSCPMMELADLAIVCDAPAFVAALLPLLTDLSRRSATPSTSRGPGPGA